MANSDFPPDIGEDEHSELRKSADLSDQIELDESVVLADRADSSNNDELVGPITVSDSPKVVSDDTEPVKQRSFTSYLEQHQLHSYEVGKIHWIFFMVAILGCLADLLFMADAFMRIGLGKISLLEQLTSGYYYLDEYGDKRLYVTSAIEIFLALLVCSLAVAFMFKAGSAKTEKARKASWCFIVVWSLLGVCLVFVRLYICITHLGVGASDAYVLPFISDWFPDWSYNDISQFLKELLVAFLLLIFYFGTGVSAYQSGKTLGNVYMHVHKRAIRDCEDYIKSISKSFSVMARLEREINTLSKREAELEQEAASQLQKQVKKKEMDIIFNGIVAPYRRFGIIVGENILPLTVSKEPDSDDAATEISSRQGECSE